MSFVHEDLEETLSHLIAEGEEIVERGGDESGGYNEAGQPEYISWRTRALIAFEELGSAGKHLLAMVGADRDGAYYYRRSATLVLNALKQAVPVARRRRAARPSSVAEAPPGSRDVFLAHGHDRAMLDSVARVLEHLGLRPQILIEQQHVGTTIIEALEKNASAACAVILLTPDDVGRAMKENDLKPRARQNAIMELGFFMGRLGRGRVIVLCSEGVERPSDVAGLLYITIDGGGGWTLNLAKALESIGLSVDRSGL